MKKIFLVLSVLFFTMGCEETDYPFIFPERYFPAYPESYWVYSNGTTVKVDPGYHKHFYYKEVGSTTQSEYAYVPRINNQFVYKYKITQNSTLVPLKTLLAPGSVDAWTVDYWEDREVLRKVTANAATVTLSLGIGENNQTVFDSVIMVVEYIGTQKSENWKYRESYAPDIGLIRREINLSDTSVVPHIEMELVRYHINNNSR
jgi:hypothetical protein